MNKDKIYMSKTPLRVSILGGGTDMSYFYDKYNGYTISFSIDKFIYVTAKFHSNIHEKYRLNYSTTENTNSINEIKNLRIKYALKYLKIKKPIYINSFSDIPSNTGLGSSSAFTVGVLKVLSRLMKINLSQSQIAEIAFKIESKITNSALGKQDHYIASYGGFKFITYKKKSIKIKNIILNSKLKREFFKNCYLVWTGKSRKASSVLADQKKNKNKNIKNLIMLNELTKKMYKNILNSKYSSSTFGNILSESWKIKKKFSTLISNKKIDTIYKELVKCGVYGAKLLGAGNGGFFLILVDKKNLNKLKIKRLKYFKINIVNDGSKVI